MNPSSTVIKLTAVTLATAGAVAAALAQQAPATAPNWNAQSGAHQSALPAVQSPAAAPSAMDPNVKMVSPRGNTKAPPTSPYRAQDTARAPSFPPDGSCTQLGGGGNVVRVSVPATTQGPDARGFRMLVVTTNVGKKAFVLDDAALPSFKTGRDVQFNASVTSCHTAVTSMAWPA